MFTAQGNAWKEGNLSYDLIGNIKTLQRYGNGGAVTDGTYLNHNFTYNYTSNTNTAANAAKSSNYGSYQYNNLGQLRQDNITGGQVRNYQYEVTEKVRKLLNSSNVVQVEFFYDEMGKRLRKWSNAGGTVSETVYVRDNSGNVLCIYTKQPSTGGSFVQAEIPIYGSDRIGNYVATNTSYNYELKDHLGNVRAVFAGTKRADGSLDILTSTDYYALGGTFKKAGTTYRYGYQGQYSEKDGETGYNG